MLAQYEGGDEMAQSGRSEFKALSVIECDWHTGLMTKTKWIRIIKENGRSIIGITELELQDAERDSNQRCTEAREI